MLESLTRWGGVVDELDFASQLCSWHKTGFKDLGDTEGYITSNTIVKVDCKAWNLWEPVILEYQFLTCFTLLYTHLTSSTSLTS